jgi:hypothetical protein
MRGHIYKMTCIKKFPPSETFTEMHNCFIHVQCIYISYQNKVIHRIVKKKSVMNITIFKIPNKLLVLYEKRNLIEQRFNILKNC